MHLRGRATIRQGLVDEADPARVYHHQLLKDAALQGEFAAAEAALEEMARQGHVPGPRAYHALAFSHVKGANAAGALKAIRRCWDSGLQPLPETYAAVIHAFAMEGNMETAEAVYASNRRAAIDYSKAWLALTAAMFQAQDADRAMELFAQVCGIAQRGAREDNAEGVASARCPAALTRMPLPVVECRARRRGWCPAPHCTST